MNKLTFSLAIFLGAIQPVHFSDLSDNNLESTLAQISTDLKSESLSSIYAKWIELPDCQKFTLADGSWDLSKGEIV